MFDWWIAQPASLWVAALALLVSSASLTQSFRVARRQRMLDALGRRSTAEALMTEAQVLVMENRLRLMHLTPQVESQRPEILDEHHRQIAACETFAAELQRALERLSKAPLEAETMEEWCRQARASQVRARGSLDWVKVGEKSLGQLRD
jgi:hypothetical protein